MPRIEACRNCRCKTPYDFWVEHDKLCEDCIKAGVVPKPNLEKIERLKEWPKPPPIDLIYESKSEPDIDPGNYSDYVHIQTKIITGEQAMEIDRWIGIHLKPKPRWMPQSTHEWFLKTLVELRSFDKPPISG